MAKKRRKTDKEALRVFLEQAQSDSGGYYKHIFTDRPVEFVRPLGGPFVRVEDMRNGAKTNVHYTELEPLPEMEVLALMTWTEEDERRATGPETISTEDTEPQEPGDVEFLH